MEEIAPLLPARRKPRERLGSAALACVLAIGILCSARARASSPRVISELDREAGNADRLTHDEVLEYLSAADEAYFYCTIKSALCANAVCTLNSDKLTANCGCLSMDSDAGNPAQFTLGWSSFVLATSTVFQTGLREIADFGSVRNEPADKLCAASEVGSLWNSSRSRRDTPSLMLESVGTRSRYTLHWYLATSSQKAVTITRTSSVLE